MSRRLRRWWWLVLIVPLGIGLARVHLDIEVLNLLPADVEEVQGLKLYQQHFTNSRELLITVRGAEAESAESAVRMIAAQLREQTNLVANATWQPPWVEHPEQMAELVACLWLNQPPEVFRALTNRLAPDHLAAVLQDTRDQLTTSISPLALGRLGYDPFDLTQSLDDGQGAGLSFSRQQDWFASDDGTFRVVYVEARAAASDYRADAAWLKRIHEAVARCQAEPGWPAGITLGYTGAPAFVAEIATGMERDMKGSMVCMLALVAGLFWWAHRSWRPLLWLTVLLALVVLGTLAAGGLIFGKVNAISMGFAAILLGLAVDYALVLYQEAAASPQLLALEIRRLLTPSIVWSAATTAAAFGILSFAGLPGLAQLGSLVAIGVLLAAGVMLFGFLPFLRRGRAPSATPAPASPTPGAMSIQPRGTRALTVVIGLLAGGLLLWRGPRVDHSTSPLQPRHSPAQIAFDELEREMNRQGEPVLLVVAGRDEAEVAHRLDRVEDRLAEAKAKGQIQSFNLPTRLWPHVGRARTNLAAAQALVGELEAMKTAVREAGFTSDAMALTETVLNYWAAHAHATGAIWPTNQAGRWILKRAAARAEDGWLAAGTVLCRTNVTQAFDLKQLHAADAHVWVTGWPLLGDALLRHVESRLGGLVTAMIVMVTGCLWLAFRRWGEVLLSGATLGFSVLLLLAVMGLASWNWNLMNLMAIPLLLGAGVDYTIHIQLALRRHDGDIRGVRQITGRAVMLCAATTVAGFGSNAFASNAGLAALGQVCALGIAIVYLSAVYLLPAWWLLLGKGQPSPSAASAASGPSSPSAIYSARSWSVGYFIVRCLPVGLCVFAGRWAATLYGWLRPQRRAVVEQNLLPVLAGDAAAARRAARRLYGHFGVKLVHLLRNECGRTEAVDFALWNGWQRVVEAQAQGRGVLLVTPHLGDWELGAYRLAQQGVPLLVLTQPEPGSGFTELRQRSRARHGIETLVVGQDAFAFVEIIKRLQAGAVVALLVDRPPPPTAVTVELFGRPFQASIAAAELARAAGCIVLPGYVVRHRHGSEARILPEIPYDRQALGNRDARRELTQRILRALEPAIQQYADQWYHFVPVWPDHKP